MNYTPIKDFDHYVINKYGIIVDLRNKQDLIIQNNTVILEKDNIDHSFPLTQLIYETFHGSLNPDEYITFIDNNPHNLHYKNLSKSKTYYSYFNNLLNILSML